MIPTLLERVSAVLSRELRVRGGTLTGFQLAEILLAEVPVTDGVLKRKAVCWRCRHPLVITTDGRGDLVEDCPHCRQEIAQLARGIRQPERTIAISADGPRCPGIDGVPCGNPIQVREAGEGRRPKRCDACQLRIYRRQNRGKGKLAA